MKYEFKIINGDDGKESKVEAMSFKKLSKKLDPKKRYFIEYTNKKGKYVCHSIMKGKKQTDVFWKNPKLANMTKDNA